MYHRQTASKLSASSAASSVPPLASSSSSSSAPSMADTSSHERSFSLATVSHERCQSVPDRHKKSAGGSSSSTSRSATAAERLVEALRLAVKTSRSASASSASSRGKAGRTCAYLKIVKVHINNFNAFHLRQRRDPKSSPRQQRLDGRSTQRSRERTAYAEPATS